MASLQVMILNTTQFQLLYNDSGSGADYDVQTWRPSPPMGFSSLGDHAESASGYSIYGTSPLGAVIVVKDVTESQTALAAPTGFTQVWNDSGSGGDEDGSFWYPTAPEGYVALGCVAQIGDTEPSTDVMMCVREDLVMFAPSGPLVWSGHSSGAHEKVALWRAGLNPAETPAGIDVGTFMASPNYNAYSGPFFVLDPNEVEWIENDDAWGSMLQSLIGNLSVGFAYAVASDGVIRYCGGYGYARAPWETDSPGVAMTAATPMNLASISKLITALALASLIEDDLDTMLGQPFYQYVPTITKWGQNVQSITLLNLLSMKSGMPPTTEYYGADYWESMEAWCAQDANAKDIGETFNYNNNNYAILQAVIEYLYQQSTGTTLDYVSIVQQTVLAPTGATGIMATASPPVTLTYNSQNLKDHQAGVQWNNFVAWMASGGWIGSALDLTTLMAGVLALKVVNANTLNTMMSQKLGFIVSGTLPSGAAYYGMNGLLYMGGSEPAGLNTAVQYFPPNQNYPTPMVVSLVINTTEAVGGGKLWQPGTIWTAYGELCNNIDFVLAEASRLPVHIDTIDTQTAPFLM